MSSSILTSPLRSLRRGRIAAVTAASCVALAVTVAPAPAAAGVVSAWTPAPAGLVQTPRACPSPATAAAYDATCWTVSNDQTNPLYSPSAPYPWGQCTYWAIEMRPDIWNNQSASDSNPSNWTAYTWAQHGAQEGLAVDHVPSSGSIMVWPQTGSDQTGHVAYVQSASYDQSSGEDLITVQEMNDTTFDDPSLGQGDTMTLRETASQLAGLQFVHPAGYVASPLPVVGPSGTAGSAPSGSGSGAGAAGSSAGSTPTASASSVPVSAPHLTLQVAGRLVRVSSTSAAPLRATVTRPGSGAVVRRSRVLPGGTVRLPAGRVRVCVSQAARGRFKAAQTCVTVRRHHGGPHGHSRRRVRTFAQTTTAALLER